MKIALVCCPVWLHSIPPFSLAVLQAYLKEAGYQIELMDLRMDFCIKHRIWYKYLQILSYIYKHKPGSSRLFYYLNSIPKRQYNRLVKKIISTGADVICFTTYDDNILMSLYIACKIKENNPQKKIIFGGPACFSKKVRDAIIKSKSVDHIVVGEGDMTLLEILKNINNKSHKLKNFFLDDLDQEPLPDFSGFDLDKYKYKMIPYSTSRGCNHNCTYCFDRIYWQKYRYKSAKKIYIDLKKLKDLYGINAFYFTDSRSFGNIKNIEKLCDLIIKNKLKIKWMFCHIRCDGLDAKIFKKMKDAGCKCIAFGIESGSQRILDLMKKNYCLTEVEKVISDASKAGIRVHTYFMVGYPAETWYDFLKTIKFICNNRRFIDYVICGSLAIFEGTELYHAAEKFGIQNKESRFWFSKNSNFLIRLMRFIILILLTKIYINRSKSKHFFS